MNREETKKIIKIMTCSYPNFKPTQPLSEVVDVWTAMLSDLSYKECSQALARWIQTDRTGFAPTIGQLRGYVADAKTEFMTEFEAWSYVKKALRNSGYGYEEEFLKLPEIVQKTVGDAMTLHRWSQMDTKELDTIQQSHFVKVYRTVVHRETEQISIAPNLERLEVHANKVIQ